MAFPSQTPRALTNPKNAPRQSNLEGSGMIGKAYLGALQWSWERFQSWLSHPHLGRRLALIAFLLSSPALCLDFYLDDYIGRYIYSDLEGAARLYHNYSGGYGLALGDPAENHWQMEAGWAPWWQYERLRIAMFRPIGVLLHTLDFSLWPNAPYIMHAHNLLWLVAMVLAVTSMYRSFLGTLVGGAAALLFALDNTHGFTVGHICNRHALVATTLGALSLGCHLRLRREGGLRRAVPGPLLYLLGLLTSESTIAIAGYVLAYELLASQDGLRKRILAASPYVVITLAWRALYNAAGFGADGSRVYIDLGREPLRYARAFLERGPMYLLGMFSSPPAETYNELPPELAPMLMGWALFILVTAIWALWPLWKSSRMARFWGLGMLGSLIPAATTDPNNRQLIFASFGALGMLAQAWHYYATREPSKTTRPQRWAQGLAVLFIGFRLTLSPVLLTMATMSVVLMTPMHNAAAALDDRAAGRDLIFVTAPYEYSVRMVQFFKRIYGHPLPRRIRTISCGSQKTRVERTGPRTLEVTFEGGLISTPEVGLHRDPRFKLAPGSQVTLEGFQVEVLHSTEEKGPDRARFTFDKPLEDPSLVFYRWGERRYVRFVPPKLGEVVELPGAAVQLGLD